MTTEQLINALEVSQSHFYEMLNLDHETKRVYETARQNTSLVIRSTLINEATKSSREVDREVVKTTVYVNEKTGKEIKRETEKEVKVIKKPSRPSIRALEHWSNTQEGFIRTDRYEHTGKDGKPIEVNQTADALRSEIEELLKAST